MQILEGHQAVSYFLVFVHQLMSSPVEEIELLHTRVIDGTSLELT